MALTWPASLPPSIMSPPRPVLIGRDHVSPITSTTQRSGSSSHLHEISAKFGPMTADDYRLAVAITDKAGMDEVIMPIYELFKPNLFTRIEGTTIRREIDGTVSLISVAQEYVKILESVQSSEVIKVAPGASGFNLPISLAPVEYDLKAGQPISISTGGRWYMYRLAADSPAGLSFKTLTLTSRIRTSHLAGDLVAIDRAYIQGHITPQWEDADPNSGYVLSMTLREAC